MSNNKMNASEREAYIQKNKEDADTLLRSTQEKIPGLFEPQQYQQLLCLFSRFHRYSYINIVLIFLQFPRAEYLAGFKFWEKTSLNIWNDPARPILKQEYKGKGIRLLAPYTNVSNRQRRLMNFIVSVYDVSQTNGLPPQEETPNFNAKITSTRLLSALRQCSFYRIVVAGRENNILQGGLLGYCDHDQKQIVLSESLRGTNLLKETLRQVVIAEASALVYNNNELRDLIVESTIFILRHHFASFLNEKSNNGFFDKHPNQTSKESFLSLHAIQTISHKLIDSIEDFFEEIEQYDSFFWFDEEALLEFDTMEAY